MSCVPLGLGLCPHEPESQDLTSVLSSAAARPVLEELGRGSGRGLCWGRSRPSRSASPRLLLLPLPRWSLLSGAFAAGAWSEGCSLCPCARPLGDCVSSGSALASLDLYSGRLYQPPTWRLCSASPGRLKRDRNPTPAPRPLPKPELPVMFATSANPVLQFAGLLESPFPQPAHRTVRTTHTGDLLPPVLSRPPVRCSSLLTGAFSLFPSHWWLHWTCFLKNICL